MAPKVGSFSRNDHVTPKKKGFHPHPPKVKIYECVVCHVNFESKGSLESHVKDSHHHGDCKKMFNCSCGNFIRKRDKRLHVCPGSSSSEGVSAPNPAIQPERKSIWKLLPKKTKVVQSAWCEVCKIDCNSKGVLDQHKLGKKHLKNLQKSKVATPTISAPIVAAPSSASIIEPPTSIAAPPASVVTSTSLPVPTPTSTPTPAPSDKPFIGPQQKPKSQKSRKKAVARTEDLETKRRKVLLGGAAAGDVHACSICNVVCNSDTVYNYHIAGQRHASMAKKHALAAGVAPVV